MKKRSIKKPRAWWGFYNWPTDMYLFFEEQARAKKEHKARYLDVPDSFGRTVELIKVQEVTCKRKSSRKRK